MATIPRYDGHVTPQANPSARLQAVGTGTEGLVQGVNNVARIVQHVAQREQEKLDNARLMEADQQLAALEDRLFHDPENGAYAKRGKDAVEHSETLWAEWDKQAGAISQNIPDRIKPRYQAFTQGRRSDLQRSYSRHAANEADRYYQEVAQSSVDMAANAAGMNYTNPDRVDTEIARAQIAIETQFEGKPPELIAKMRMATETKVRGMAITRMMADDPMTAKAYLDKYRERLDQNVVAQFDDQLEPLITDTRAQETAATLLQSGSALTALEKAADIADPRERQAVVSRIKLEIDIDEARKREYDDGMKESLLSNIEAVDPFKPLSDTLSPEQFSYASKNGLLSNLESRNKQRISGLEPQTNPRKFNEIQTLMANAAFGDQAALKTLQTTNPVEWFGSLNAQDREFFQNKRDAILNADPKARDKAAEYSTEAKDLEAFVWGPLGTKDMEKDEVQSIQYRFNQEYLQEKGLMQEQLGRKITSKERQTLMQDLMLSFVKKGAWYSSDETLRGYELDTVIPQSERAEIINEFVKANEYTPTDAQIRVMYAMKNGYTLNADDTE